MNTIQYATSTCTSFMQDNPDEFARLFVVRGPSTILFSAYQLVEKIYGEGKTAGVTTKLELALAITGQLITLMRVNMDRFSLTVAQQATLSTILDGIATGLVEQSSAITDLFANFSQANKTGGRIDRVEQVLLTNNAAEICCGCFSAVRRAVT